jgi:uncharacterized protein
MVWFSHPMTEVELAALVVIYFLTSIVGVVTGSNSLITVPALLSFGIEPRVALATNMLALTFMSVGGTVPFLGQRTIDRRRLPLLIALTLVGSILGALLVLVVASQNVPLLISIFMVAMVGFTLVQGDAGVVPPGGAGSFKAEIAGYVATLVLGIYGGFFSGGYVTLLTAAYVLCFRMTFIQAIATTKLINVFSSLVATVVFVRNGLVDYRLGVILGITMFAGAMLGGRLALRLDNRWLRRIFLVTVIALALKTLVYDVLL